jgi:cytochrome P450
MKSDLPPHALPDNLRTMVLAGSETTGLSLAWAIYELTRAPSVRRQVEEEVDRILQGRIPTYEDLDRLVVTRSVVDETLRLYPSVWQFPRDPVADDELAGHHIPVGSTVMISAFGTHRNPDLWENPNTFDPARFRDAEEQRGRHKFAYLPFGGGRRQCIGKPLALAILVAAVAMACQRFRFSLPLDQEEVQPGAFITIFPAKFPAQGIRVSVRRRTRTGRVEQSEQRARQSEQRARQADA